MSPRLPPALPVRSPLLGTVRRLTTIVSVVALAGLGGPLSCKENPFGPSAAGYVEPKARLTVEVRGTDGVGIGGVALEVRESTDGGGATTVYARVTTATDGTAYVGELSVIVDPYSYRLFFTLPAGYGVAPGQENPMKFSLTKAASGGAPGSGLYADPARVIVRLVRLP